MVLQIRLLKNLILIQIIFIVKDNKVENISDDNRANKIDKILAKFKNIKKLSKIKNLTKAKYLEQLTFINSKTSSVLFIKDYFD